MEELGHTVVVVKPPGAKLIGVVPCARASAAISTMSTVQARRVSAAFFMNNAVAGINNLFILESLFALSSGSEDLRSRQSLGICRLQLEVKTRDEPGNQEPDTVPRTCVLSLGMKPDVCDAMRLRGLSQYVIRLALLG